MYIKHDNVRMKGIVLDLHDVNLNKLPYIGHFSVLTQNKIRHFITRYCNDLDIKLVFTCFKIGNLFSVKDPIPGGLRSCVVYIVYSLCCLLLLSLHVRAVTPVMSAKQPGIFPHAYVST